jgi:hypothetical protein
MSEWKRQEVISNLEKTLKKDNLEPGLRRGLERKLDIIKENKPVNK